jgi:beta-barrel assembly-enhancing protease
MKITPNQFAWIFLITLIAVIGWGGYAIYDFIKNDSDKLVSIENEKKLGDMLAEQSFDKSAGYERIKDPVLDSCIQTIQERLLKALGGSPYTYEWFVVDRPDVNAFAIPGGKIFIQTGLIRFCKTPEELASVLAHEMGHVERRHTIKNIAKQLGLQTLLAVITNGGSSGLEEVSGQMVSLYFSREDESEADDFALDLLMKAGIPPSTLGVVFSRMKETGGDMEGAMNMLSTHPELDDRANKSSNYVVPADFQEVKLPIDWQRVQLAAMNDSVQ